MAKKGKATGTANGPSSKTPKDELAMKETSTPTSAPKVDGAAASSNRKVRISEDPSGSVSKPRKASAAGKKGASKPDAPVNDGNPTTGTVSNGTVTAEILGEAEDGEEAQKFSPKHRNKKRQPEKSALKNGNGNGKKRKAAERDEDDDEEEAVEAETSAAGASASEENEDEGELDFIAGFESGSDEDDGEDSSDEEAEPQQKVSIKELPEPKQGKAVKAGKGKKDSKPKTGVIYLGRIPHGFHEDEMKSYFSQFGEVTRLRLSRNKRTGASKHYAFIEFEHASVAQIVAETMDNYLLHGHIMQCKVVPPDQIHPKMWIGANKKFRPIPKGRVERLRHNAPKTDEQKEAISKRLVKRDEQKREKLKELGIEYDFTGYAKTLPEKKKKDQKEEKKAIEAAKKLETQVKKDAATVKEPKAKKVKKSK